MNPTNASQQSSRTHLTPESSLRPRNKQRLLSGLDDEPGRDPNAQASLEGSRAASPAASPYASRTASPIPGAGPSRSSSQQQVSRSRESTVSKGALGWASPGGSAQDPLAQLSGLWGSSWSTLQGLASNVLGSDASGDVPRKRRPFEATHGRKATTSAPPAQWGPAERDTQVGSGTKEEREAMVRAMKRKDLLMANGHLNMDATGKFKRRNSDERISSSAPPTEHDDRDALVYIHRVRPEDTLAGITIKYNCQAATLRKSNRMWAQDSVQTRRHLVLPVDACGVKGRPVPPPEEQKPKQPNVEDDLLLPTPGSEYPPIHATSLPTNGWHGPASVSTSNLSKSVTASEASTNADNEPPWKHEGWVMLPHSKDPIEIARLPRRDLGFFPPARRKSLTFSDNDSAVRTPSASLELNRSDTRTSTSSMTSHGTAKSPRQSNSSNVPNRHRARAPSITQSFKLDGPGGVGTFNRNVRKPGPAQDGLNKIFSQHLPNLAPPPGKDYFGTWNPAQLAEAKANGDSMGPSGTATPVGVGGVGGSSTGFDFEQVGGAIEGWMRKVATKASTLVPPAPLTPGKSGVTAADRQRAAGAGLGAAGMGGDINDLIELTDAFEVGDDDEEEETNRGRASSGSGRRGPEDGVRRREARSGTPSKGAKGD
ncbi:hypothetical protein SLS56_001368 [Neofusicoccum ribis]|uniref:LysM domain-containing protein n=1 Tax=Neofusicoccum ribis TaxID=45134 RepID=A0ABR3T9S1_9PEZI